MYHFTDRQSKSSTRFEGNQADGQADPQAGGQEGWQAGG